MTEKFGLLLFAYFTMLAITGCSKEQNTKVSDTSSALKAIELAEAIDLPEAGEPELNYMTAADIDGNGTLDLVIGNFAGEIAVKINSGTKEKPSFKAKENLKADDQKLKVPHW